METLARLPLAEAFYTWPATDLLAVYWTRWQIENVFQAITEVFELRQLIGCTPRATVFQASLCLVMYNVLQVLRGYAAAAASEPVAVEALSAEQIFTDLHEELVGLHRLLAVEELLRCLPAPATADPVAAWLRELLGRAWSASWRKAVNKKRRPHQPMKKALGAHTSVKRRRSARAVPVASRTRAPRRRKASTSLRTSPVLPPARGGTRTMALDRPSCCHCAVIRRTNSSAQPRGSAVSPVNMPAETRRPAALRPMISRTALRPRPPG